MPKRKPASSWPTIRRDLRQWKKIHEEFPGDARLRPTIIYALPLALIDALRTHAPNLMTEADAHFEKRLRARCVSGFWARQPFFSDILDGTRIELEEFEASAVFQERFRRADQSYRETRNIIATDRFQPAIEKQRDRISAELESRVRLRLKGYAGWLVTHHQFRLEMQCFITSHERLMKRQFELAPWHLEHLPVRPGDGPDEIRHFRLDGSRLLSRWSLSEMPVPGLPEPNRLGYMTTDVIPDNGATATGFSVFVPWPLLVDKGLTLREIGDYYQNKRDLTHLEDWLQGERNWGYERFSKLLELDVYRRRALIARYGDRLDNQVEAVDRAFAYFWDSASEISKRNRSNSRLSIDLVRRIRTRHKNRLAACQRAIDEYHAWIATGAPRDPNDIARENQLAEEMQTTVDSWESDPAYQKWISRKRKSER